MCCPLLPQREWNEMASNSSSSSSPADRRGGKEQTVSDMLILLILFLILRPVLTGLYWFWLVLTVLVATGMIRLNSGVVLVQCALSLNVPKHILKTVFSHEDQRYVFKCYVVCWEPIWPGSNQRRTRWMEEFRPAHVLGLLVLWRYNAMLLCYAVILCYDALGDALIKLNLW